MSSALMYFQKLGNDPSTQLRNQEIPLILVSILKFYYVNRITTYKLKSQSIQTLTLVIGEQGSDKDLIFDLINRKNNEQILFGNIQIKQLFDESRIPDMLLINFPELDDIDSTLQQLFTLSKHLRINSIIICLEYRKQIKQVIQKLIQKVQNLFNYTETKLMKFFVNNSPNLQINNDSNIHYFKSVKKLSQENKDFINNIIFASQQQNKQSQYNNLKKYKPDNVNLMSQIADQFKYQFNQLLENSFEDKKNLGFILQDINEELKAHFQNIQIKKEYSSNLKISEFYCDLLHLLFFCILGKQKNISIQISQNYKLETLYYCYNCQIIYDQQDNSLVQYSILLFLLQKELLKTQTFYKCPKCKNQSQLSQYLGNMLEFLEKAYYLQLIDEYYSQNISIFQTQYDQDKSQIQQKLQQSLLNVSQSLQASELNLVIDQNHIVEKSLKVLLLNNEQKSKVFDNYLKSSRQHKDKNFVTGNTISNLFHLVDAPLFDFDEDKDKQEQLYSEYFRQNAIHYIFLCLHYQRTSLMKERAIRMIKYLPNVNRSQMGLIIIVNNPIGDCQKNIEDEQSIINSMQGILKQVIVVEETDNQNEIIEKIQNCVKNIDISQELSFKDTIFGIQEDDSSQILLQQQFQQIAEKIQNDSKLQQQQLLLDYQNRQQQLELLKVELENKKIYLKNSYQEKIDDCYKQIEEYKQQSKQEIDQIAMAIKNIEQEQQSITKSKQIKQNDFNQYQNKKGKKQQKRR